MANINHGSSDLEANALVTVACASLAMLQDKVEIIAANHFPAVHLLAQWWPVLLIIAGLILLVTSWETKDEIASKPPVPKIHREMTHERRS
jgi:hypothetical protein